MKLWLPNRGVDFLAKQVPSLEQSGVRHPRGRLGTRIRRSAISLVLVTWSVLSGGCDQRSQPKELPNPERAPARISAEHWLGAWRGPEGTSLELNEAGGRYRVTIRNLDGPRTFDGMDGERGLTFVRDGVQETIRAGSGKDTGMKWLAEKTDCLVIKPGEGYCRD